MNAWDAYIDGNATGDPDFANEGRTKGKDPFADHGDGTGPYAVYNTLYEAVKQKLTEDDPTTTDWEGCKGMINNGEIGAWFLVPGQLFRCRRQATMQMISDICHSRSQ